MAKNKSSRFGDPFSKRTNLSDRKQGTRTERVEDNFLPLVAFSFKDFDIVQCPPGQTFKEWEKCGLLSDMFTKMVDLSCKNRQEASSQKMIKIYGEWPSGHTDFKYPKHIEGEIQWGTIQKVGGQKARIAGYMIDNVFYIVFLDKEHKFYKSEI